MAGFAESRTDRFKAIVSAAPVIDQFSEYGTEKVSATIAGFTGIRGSTTKMHGVRDHLQA